MAVNEGILDRLEAKLEALMSGILGSEAGSVSDKDMSLLPLKMGGKRKGAGSDKDIGLLGRDPEKILSPKLKGASSDSETENTIRFLRSQGKDTLADMVEAGAMTASAAMQLGIRSLTEEGYGAMSNKEMQQYPIEGWTNMGDTPEVQEFINSLPEDLMMRVEQYRGSASDADFQKMLRDLMASASGNAGAMSAGDFQRYNTGGNLQDLGFTRSGRTGYQQGY
jgi:hypothetical protein